LPCYRLAYQSAGRFIDEQPGGPIGVACEKQLNKEHMKIKTIVCSTVLVGLLALPALVKGEENEGNEHKVAWKDVPAAVQKTITDNANGGAVHKVKMETKDDKVIYEAVVKGAEGNKTEIKVAADGTLLKVKAKGKKEEKEKDDDDAKTNKN
jgi:hypothetical protein